MAEPFAAEIYLPPLLPPLMAAGGQIQIVGADKRVTLSLIDPDRNHAVMQWTPAEARLFAGKVEQSAALAIAMHGTLAQVQLPGGLPVAVADYIRQAADRADQ